MTPRSFRRPAALGGTLVLAGLLAACSAGPGGASTPSAATSEAPSAAPSAAAAADCPTSEPAPLAAGETRVVTIETSQGPMELTIEADLSPIAAGNFVALA
ncbi:MAG: hypothetical protein ACAH65_10595, partial [Chloroflexota bacterium]